MCNKCYATVQISVIFFSFFLSAGWSSLNPFRQIQTLYKWQSSHLRGVFPIGKKKKIAFSKSSRMCCPVASLSPPLCLTNWLNYTSGGRRLQASGCCSVAARRRWGRGQWNFCTIKPGILPCASLTNAGRDHNKPLREGKLNTTSTIAQRKSRHGRGFPPCHLTRSKHNKKKNPNLSLWSPQHTERLRIHSGNAVTCGGGGVALKAKLIGALTCLMDSKLPAGSFLMSGKQITHWTIHSVGQTHCSKSRETHKKKQVQWAHDTFYNSVIMFAEVKWCLLVSL